MINRQLKRKQTVARWLTGRVAAVNTVGRPMAIGPPLHWVTQFFERSPSPSLDSVVRLRFWSRWDSKPNRLLRSPMRYPQSFPLHMLPTELPRTLSKLSGQHIGLWNRRRSELVRIPQDPKPSSAKTEHFRRTELPNEEKDAVMTEDQPRRSVPSQN